METLTDLKSALSINHIVSKYNSVVAAAITLLSAILGPQWYLFAAFFILNIFDWLTGWYKARCLKIESSAAGLVGIIKKLWYWLLVTLAFLMAAVIEKLGINLLGLHLSFMPLIGWFTLACLAVNEGRSICENLIDAGVPVPTVLTRGLSISEKLLDTKIKESFPKEPPAPEDTPLPPGFPPS